MRIRVTLSQCIHLIRRNERIIYQFEFVKSDKYFIFYDFFNIFKIA